MGFFAMLSGISASGKDQPKQGLYARKTPAKYSQKAQSIMWTNSSVSGFGEEAVTDLGKLRRLALPVLCDGFCSQVQSGVSMICFPGVSTRLTELACCYSRRMSPLLQLPASCVQLRTSQFDVSLVALNLTTCLRAFLLILLKFGECNGYDGQCHCPDGWGGIDCLTPRKCDSRVLTISRGTTDPFPACPVCGSLADADARYPRPEGELCECQDGWSGINCNGESAVPLYHYSAPIV